MLVKHLRSLEKAVPAKSVTALSVMQLLPEKTSRIEGSIKLDDEELIGASPARMREIRGNRVAMIFQNR